MSLNGGVWKAVAGPGLWKRYARVLSGGGGTIKGAWESSAAGSH